MKPSKYPDFPDTILADNRKPIKISELRNIGAARNLNDVLRHEKNLRAPRTSEECYFTNAGSGFPEEREPIAWSTWAIMIVTMVFALLALFGVFEKAHAASQCGYPPYPPYGMEYVCVCDQYGQNCHWILVSKK